MSEIKGSAVWNGMPVDTYTDMRTGEMEIYAPGFRLPGDLLAKSTITSTIGPPAPGEPTGKLTWSYGDQTYFRNSYNAYQKKNGRPKLNQKDFNEYFFTSGVNTFNNLNGKVLNNTNNYTKAGISQNEVELIRIRQFDNRIPLSVNAAGVQVNLNGTVPKEQTIQPVEPDTNQNGTIDDSGDGPIVVTTTATVEGVKPIKGPEESKAGPKNLGAANLRYPKDTPPAGFPFDFIKITAMKYVPSSLDYISSGGKTPPASPTSRIKKGNSNKKISQGSITLPMQPNLSETQSVGWGGDALDPFRAALAGASMGAIQKFGEGDLMGAIQKVGGDIAKGAQKFASDPATLDFVAAYFAGRAVGSNITGRTTGQVINPNMELLFNGPTLRTFNFQFRMTPRYDKEAEEVRKIIKTFKANMAVQRSDSNLFLKTPNVFQLEYIANGGTPHPFLNKFKLCAMTSFNVNYTPDGSYMTYGDGSLTAYDMSMSFSELEPIYQDDYDDINGSTMGF